jgi:ATP-dependent DNA helicase PIF1
MEGAIAVTATTGIAALHIGGTTLHSFAGIGLGQDPVEVLCERIFKSRQSRQRWESVRCLIVDEVSMLEGGLFDKVEAIARDIRRSSLPFGGIQVVLCGDFFQLPPVGKSNETPTKFAFEAEKWPSVVGSNMVELTEVLYNRIIDYIIVNYKGLSAKRFQVC